MQRLQLQSTLLITFAQASPLSRGRCAALLRSKKRTGAETQEVWTGGDLHGGGVAIDSVLGYKEPAPPLRPHSSRDVGRAD
jgi:hypothetical protein